jgi:mannose-1-phosphate guanylyltransferase
MILAGGGGTRFWPRSRAQRPKQFLTLAGARTLLQATADRTEAQVPAERTWVVTSAAHAGEVRTQLPSLPSAHIVGEPTGRDTAAAVGLGAALIHRADPTATMLVMPADHVIEPAQEFRRAVHVAEALCAEYPDTLITFGIVPTYPAIGYGYIQRGAEVSSRQGIRAYAAQAFKEKPPLEIAQQYVAVGDYFWNAGIFAWRTAAILTELERHAPAVHTAVTRIAAAWGTADQERVFATEYAALAKVSIDYAVMEKAARVLVVQAPFAWDDVGSWLAVERLQPQDADGNTVLAEHSGLNTRNCVIVGDPGRLITTIGVQNLVIVQDGDALLIADRADEAAVKQLVDQLKTTGRTQYL